MVACKLIKPNKINLMLVKVKDQDEEGLTNTQLKPS